MDEKKLGSVTGMSASRTQKCARNTGSEGLSARHYPSKRFVEVQGLQYFRAFAGTLLEEVRNSLKPKEGFGRKLAYHGN